MQSVAANNPTDFIFTFSYVYIFERMNLHLFLYPLCQQLFDQI